MQDLREEISDLLSDEREDRFSCPLAARKKAMDFLARREYGQVELVKKLAGKGYDRKIAEQAVVKLSAEGLQCDQRFAESFVQSRINQGKGPVRIRLDLSQRGVADAVIDPSVRWAADGDRGVSGGHGRAVRRAVPGRGRGRKRTSVGVRLSSAGAPR